jgi:hypothetical protein
MGCCYSKQKVQPQNERIVIKKFKQQDEEKQEAKDKKDDLKEIEEENSNNTVEVEIISKESEFNYEGESSEEYDVKEWQDLVKTLDEKVHLKRYALSKKRTEFSSLNHLKIFLNESPAKNDIEKAWVLYVWVTDNIDYDFEGLISKNYGKNDPDSVLLSGKCVCESKGFI